MQCNSKDCRCCYERKIRCEYSIEWFCAAAADVDLGTSFKLINVLDPTLAQDAATKNYVDTALNSSNDLANKNVFVGDINGEAAAVALSETLQLRTVA
jgi:hypothetical protein